MNNDYYIGLDIGGSHFTAALLENRDTGFTVMQRVEQAISNSAGLEEIADAFTDQISALWESSGRPVLKGLAFSFPGPFLYEKGVVKLLHKYPHLFGADLAGILSNRLPEGLAHLTSTFINDAQAFLLGAVQEYSWQHAKVLGITAGTGLGSAFYDGSRAAGKFLPSGSGFLYDLPYREGLAEDYVSAKWILERYSALSGKKMDEVKAVAHAGNEGDVHARQVFLEFGENLAGVLAEVIPVCKPGKIVFGGNIFRSYDLFKDPLLSRIPPDLACRVSEDTSGLAVRGAVAGRDMCAADQPARELFRKTPQPLLPVKKKPGNEAGYDIYPAYPVRGGISAGYGSLASWICRYNRVIMDGYSGVRWPQFVSQLNDIFRKKGIQVNWFCVDAALREEYEIGQLAAPCLGGDDPVFGRIYPGNLQDFFEPARLQEIRPEDTGLNILYGSGAALAGWEGPLVFVDVPKNEIQYRSRAGAVCNIGQSRPAPPKQQYKRFYYIDWVVLNKHKKSLLPRIAAVVDEQRGDEITWMQGDDFRTALDRISANVFRARPWFEPGAWGGNWISEQIRGVAEDVPNYAWSFELITPENGIVLENEGNLLEVSFDFLMYRNNRAILGKAAERFGDEFPIRFDFLDTFDGGNLSLQCHPKTDYIRNNFGENFTQDETYYILDATAGAEVYLGFRDDIDPDRFRNVLEKSVSEKQEVNVKGFVQAFPARKHDLFLIPNGTVHCSGRNNMVLEISSTPYIYTFKMYDWLRLDLDGNPRPLNIERGMENLDFSRKGAQVKAELISVPQVVEQGEDWQLLELPTHAEHFYRVQRMEFASEIVLGNNGHCHILSLVEGVSILVKTRDHEQLIRYAETFVIPAAAGQYTIMNKGPQPAKVVRAFMKEPVT